MRRFFIRCSLSLFWIFIIFSVVFLSQYEWEKHTENSLRIFCFGDSIDPTVAADFERSTGIKVYLNYYASNEELITKMRATKGGDYDLIIPSDYAAKQLINMQLLQPIDKSNLAFWSDLNPVFLNQFYDPNNIYSIPFEVEIFGLGYDRQYFPSIEANWDQIFNAEQIDYKITMLNDPIEAIALSSLYLYQKLPQLNESQIQQIKELLTQQRSHIAAYTDTRSDYFLATRNCPLVVTTSSYMNRAMRKFPFIGFAVPKGGTFVSIENLCIPKNSEKQELVYLFINQLFKRDVIIHHFEKNGFIPSTISSLDILPFEKGIEELVETINKQEMNLYFFEPQLPHVEMQDLWIDVKTP